MLKVLVCVSGGGTNLQAILDQAKENKLGDVEIVRVISNNANAYALTRAANFGVKSVVIARKGKKRETFTQALVDCLKAHDIDLVIFAGFMVILSPLFFDEYENRAMNVHPALIPSFCGEGFYGLHVHEKVLEYGVKLSGATVHFANAVTDGGPIILQKAVAVEEDDTPETLQRRIMEECEWKLLPEAASLFCQDKLKVEGRIVKILK